jgi:hypothetical protein
MYFRNFPDDRRPHGAREWAGHLLGELACDVEYLGEWAGDRISALARRVEQGGWEHTLLSAGIPECGYTRAPHGVRARSYDVCAQEALYRALSQEQSMDFYVCEKHAPQARRMPWIASLTPMPAVTS